MPLRSKEFHIFSIYYPEGFVSEDIEKIRHIAAKTIHNDLLQPNTVNLYVQKNKNSNEIIEFIRTELNKLKTNQNCNFSVGENFGKLMATFTIFGKLKSAPMGTPINQAMEAARNENAL